MGPADAYHEAMSSHRHYDTMATATLSLLGAVIAGTPSLYTNMKALPGAGFIFLAAVLILYFAIYIYKRFDKYATVALNVAALIESGQQPAGHSGPFGFAHIFKNLRAFPDVDTQGGGRIYNRIRFITYTAIAAYLGAFVFLLPQLVGRTWAWF
jgi:hypothetical protein